MAKYAGLVGYVTDEENPPGVWSANTTVREMRGDVLRAAFVPQGTDRVNKNITLQHRISVVGDAYSFENFYAIRWLEFMGKKWEVTMAETASPRIILTLGGIYNGD